MARVADAAMKQKLRDFHERVVKVKLRSQKTELAGKLIDMSSMGYPEGTRGIQVAGGNWRPFEEADVETVEEG